MFKRKICLNRQLPQIVSVKHQVGGRSLSLKKNHGGLDNMLLDEDGTIWFSGGRCCAAYRGMESEA